MGLIKFLKDKFTRKKDENSLSLSSKKDESLDKYDKGLEKSRKQFSNKLDEFLARRINLRLSENFRCLRL